MRHRKRRVIETSWVNLNSITHPTTGRKHYEISVNAWHLRYKTGYYLDDIRLYFDPAGNRGKKFGTKWKFRTKHQAEQLITMAILKWGA